MFGIVHLEFELPPARAVRSRFPIHRILRLGGENSCGRAGCGPLDQTGPHSLKYLRTILAIYGAGIAGTFTWLFFALSGFTTCASGLEPCRIVFGRTGQLAMIWPAYWRGRFSGDVAMTPLVSVDVVVIAVLVFFSVFCCWPWPTPELRGPDRIPGATNRRAARPSPIAGIKAGARGGPAAHGPSVVDQKFAPNRAC